MRESSGGHIRFRGIIVKPDGSEAFEVSREGRAARPRSLAPTPAANCERAPAPIFLCEA